MTSFALLRHLVLKDARHQRGWLALFWLLALLLPAATAWIVPARVQTNAAVIGLTGGFDFVLLLLLVRLIQLDPPGRDVHFLATRPVGWAELLAGKALFVALFLVVPVWIMTLGNILAVGFQCDFLDLVLALIEATSAAGALLAFAAIPALYLRQLTAVLLAGLGFILVGFIAGAVYQDYFYYYRTASADPTLASEQLKNCRWLVFNVALVFTAALTALCCYRKAAPARSFAVLAAAFFVSLTLWFWWPVNLSRFFTDQPASPAELTPDLRDKISFSLWKPQGFPQPTYSSVEGAARNNHTVSEAVKLGIELKGMEPPYFAVQTDYRAVATPQSGSTFSSSYADAISHGGGMMLETGGFGPSLLQQLAGFTPSGSTRWSISAIEAFNYQPALHRGEDLTRTAITGTTTFDIRRAFILRTLPFRSGMVLDLPRRRYRLENVAFDHGTAKFEIVTESLPITLRGDVLNWPDWNNPMNEPAWLVINRRKNEFLDSNGDSRINNVETHNLQRPLLLNGVQGVHAAYALQKEPIPADWADGAEICFFTSTSCGQVSYPYIIPAIDLPGDSP